MVLYSSDSIELRQLLGRLFDAGNHTFADAVEALGIEEGSRTHRLAARLWGEWIDEESTTRI